MKDIVKNVNGFVSRNGVLTKYRGGTGDVVIPDDITELGSYAFKKWGAKITSITVPKSVKRISWQKRIILP